MNTFNPRTMATAMALILLTMTQALYASDFKITFHNSTSQEIKIYKNKHRCISTINSDRNGKFTTRSHITLPANSKGTKKTYNVKLSKKVMQGCGIFSSSRSGHAHITIAIPRHSQKITTKLTFKPFHGSRRGRHTLGGAGLSNTKDAPSFSISGTRGKHLIVTIKAGT